MSHNHPPVMLVADVGGTNTRLALATAGHVEQASIMRFANQDAASLQSVITRYLKDTNFPRPMAACVAIAGPVENGTGRLTNLNWQITDQDLHDITGTQHVSVINDLQAQAHALGDLPPGSCETLLGVKSGITGTKLVIGIGTGCNAALALTTDTGVTVPASETGHIAMPVRSQSDLDLALSLRQTHGFASVEHVLSGSGLENLYRWHARHAPQSPPISAQKIIAAMADRSDPAAVQAVQSATQILAHLCADLALIHLPFGGVYLVGGVARALAPYLSEFGFDTNFQDMGRFKAFMSRFSISLVTDDYAALTGCAKAIASVPR